MDVKDGESRMITDEAGAAPRRPHPACAEGADEGRDMLAIVAKTISQSNRTPTIAQALIAVHPFSARPGGPVCAPNQIN
jgi:hypothetical protein